LVAGGGCECNTTHDGCVGSINNQTVAVRVLVFNCGSSSLKFQVVECDAAGGAPARAERRPRGSIEGIGATASCTFVNTDGHTLQEQRAIGTYTDAAHAALAYLRSDAAALRLNAVGHRVVHGADRFTAATRLDDAAVAAIEALSELAPLHNAAAVSVIRAARGANDVAGPQVTVPHVAVFDTAFHRTLPDYAAQYALPADWAGRHRIRRYGFHGIAHQSLVMRYAEIVRTPVAQARVITLQLGNGCSAAAIRNGQSVDTSMGFTPLEGLMMGTRSGDIDPSVVSYLMRREGVSADQVEEWLNHRAGLLGVSGRSNDMRELLAAMAEDPAARLAVEMFCYRISKYIGAYLTVLGGADALIFSGGIGAHCPLVRARVCDRLTWCGVHLDPQRNTDTVGNEARIAIADSVPVYVIPADEELLIARETVGVIGDS
jgi:acetate kinase